MKEWWTVFPKVAADQLFWGPTWISIYLLTTSILEGDKFEEAIQKVKSKCIPIIKSGLKLWVPVHMVTYGLIPQAYRLLWVGCVEIIWVTIMGSMANKKLKSDVIPN